MSQDIIVRNPIEADHIVIIRSETLARIAELCGAADSCAPADAETMEQANGLFREIDTLAKQIAADRLELTRPLDELKRAIMEAEKQATAPLATSKQALGQRLIACQRELERIRREQERQAREAAEKKAAEERARREQERQAEIARLEAERKAEQERLAQEAALFCEDAPAELPPVELPPEPIIDPIVEHLPAPLPPAPKAAATTATRKVLEIHDEDALLKAACEAGGRIHGRLVVEIDKKGIEALLKAGCPVPGARLVEVVSVRAAGRR